jgi:hypothetical protein
MHFNPATARSFTRPVAGRRELADQCAALRVAYASGSPLSVGLPIMRFSAAMPTSVLEDRTNRQTNQKSGAARSRKAQGFTEKQGQYLAFISTYSHMFRRPPAETDMQRHFQVTPPSVHQMIVPSNEMASFAVNPASPEASKSWLLRKTCLSWIGSKSASHNHCAEY